MRWLDFFGALTLSSRRDIRLLEDGEPELEAEFVGTQSITVAA